VTEGDPIWLDRRLFPYDSRFVDVHGNRLHYIDEGSGPLLLFLHGNPTWSFLYRHIVERLAHHFRCIAVDYPGFGLSVARRGYGFTPPDQTIVIEGFVDALDLPKLSIMVQDWGGPIGLGFAARRPDRVQSLIIGNSFAWPATPGMKGFSYVFGNPLARFLIRRTNVLARWLIPAGISRTLSAAELAAYLGPFPTPASRLPTWIFAREIRASAPYLAEVEAGLARLRDKPALIVWGSADGAFQAADRDRFASLFADHHIVDLVDAKHFIQEDAAPKIAAAILEWRSRLIASEEAVR
jgi:haloalkane dehalogenase